MQPISRYQVASIMSTSWRERAACRGIDYPEIFDAPAKKDDLLYMKALAICSRCPVDGECLDWVNTDRAFEGVAAGRLWHSGKREVAV